MAKKMHKEKGVWDRITLWMRSNQRILWVILLILVAFSFEPRFDFINRKSSQVLESTNIERLS